MEDFIFHNNLHVHNEGDHFTFFRANARTIIDVTLSTPQVAPRLQDWKVSLDVVGSDHLLLTWKTSISTTVREVRNWRKGDWSLFQNLLEDNGSRSHTVWSIETLEQEASYFLEDIERALDTSHPKREVTNKIRRIHNLSHETILARRKARGLLSQYRRRKTVEAYERFRDARRDYSKLLKADRRKSWKAFCDEATTPAKAAFFHRIIRGKVNQSLGMIKKDGDNMCDSPEESLAKVVDTHFPGNRDFDLGALSSSERVDVKDTAAAFITVEKVKASASLFGDYKAPGPDDICPCVFKHLGPNALVRLTEIYRASYLLGHVPATWRYSKVVFIPKPGKKDYSEARSFRPISLSPFVLKLMERIVLWHLNDTSFKTNPLSCNQHAFRPGFSTESALTNMVNSVETAFGKKGRSTFGVFLDIQGAFDNVDPKSIVRCMTRRGFDKKVISWYQHYLLGRVITVNHKGVRLQRTLTRGVPQGITITFSGLKSR